MNRCKQCDSIITPLPEIEKYTHEPMQLCLDCFVSAAKELLQTEGLA